MPENVAVLVPNFVYTKLGSGVNAVLTESLAWQVHLFIPPLPSVSMSPTTLMALEGLIPKDIRKK